MWARAVLMISMGAPLALAGCQVVPKSRLTAAETQSRALAEQNRALVAEIENREAHVKHLEERVRRAEEDLALYQEELGTDRQRRSHYENERDELMTAERRNDRGAGEADADADMDDGPEAVSAARTSKWRIAIPGRR